jgi:hypothetical protein
MTAPKVHRVPVGTLNIPLPPLATGTVGRKVQGGLPPVPYRNACSKWAACPTKWAREPFNSRQIKGEVMSSRYD